MVNLPLFTFWHSESESEVVQSCPTLCDPMACSLPGSSVHGILQTRILEWLPFPFPGIFSTQGWNLGLLHCRWVLCLWATREALQNSAKLPVSLGSLRHWPPRTANSSELQGHLSLAEPTTGTILHLFLSVSRKDVKSATTEIESDHAEWPKNQPVAPGWFSTDCQLHEKPGPSVGHGLAQGPWAC